MTDKDYLVKALELAKLARGRTLPNPMVGAIIVKDGQIIGSGHHQRDGSKHAEIEAFESLKVSPEGATLYTTLEPCCHTKKRTPPCVDRIIKEKLKRVVIGALDPNPNVAGKGEKILQAAGIQTTSGLITKEENLLNEQYRFYIKNQKPFLHLKWAQSLDGFNATSRGESKWITNEKARTIAHYLRGINGAVMVGSTTAIQDNPALSIRYELEDQFPQPHKIIVGSPVNLNPQLKVFQPIEGIAAQRFLITSTEEDEKDLIPYQDLGVEIIQVPKDKNGSLDFQMALQKLADHKIASILIEGGPHLAGSLLSQNLINKVTTFIAPIIMGEGLSSIKNLHTQKLAHALKLENITTELIDGQVFYQGYPKD